MAWQSLTPSPLLPPAVHVPVVEGGRPCYRGSKSCMRRRDDSHPCLQHCCCRQFIPYSTRAGHEGSFSSTSLLVGLVIASQCWTATLCPPLPLPSPFDARLPRMRSRERSSSYQPKPAIASGLPSHMPARDTYHSARGILYVRDVAMRTRNNAILAYGSGSRRLCSRCLQAGVVPLEIHSTAQASCHGHTRWHSFT
jgi:hypothetical protein